MSEKKRRRFYLPFIDSPIPLLELKCWECGNLIKFGKDEKGYYVEEANEIHFDPPLEGYARLAEKPREDEHARKFYAVMRQSRARIGESVAYARDRL